jgi:DNA adenine methylase
MPKRSKYYVGVLKWVGSKNAVIPLIKDVLRDYDLRECTLHEPFCGSCIVALTLVSEGKVKNAVCSDINKALINFMRAVKYDYHNLKTLIERYMYYEYDSGIYDEIRIDFNKSKDALKLNPSDDTEGIDDDELGVAYNTSLAASFYALNRTGFNGLYRENAKGEFNTPFGKRQLTTPLYLTTKAQKAYGNITFNWCSYKEALDIVETLNPELNIVYMDPPYIQNNPLSFTSYNKTPWNAHSDRDVAMAHNDLIRDGFLCISSQASVDDIEDYYDPALSLILKVSTANIVGGLNADRSTRTDVLIFNKP